MLQVYYCHKETIYEEMLRFRWRHDHHHTKQGKMDRIKIKDEKKKSNKKKYLG